MDIYTITTDETLRETISHGSSSYPFAYYVDNIWQFDFHRIDWHWHHQLEFLLAPEDAILCHVGSHTVELNKGCGMFINSGILHSFEAHSSALTPNIVFSPTLLAPEKSCIYKKYIIPIINSSLSHHIFTTDIPWENHVLQLLSQIFHLQETEVDNELSTMKLLFQLWDILVKNLNLNTDSSGMHHLNHKQARLQQMMQYIHDNYMKEITLDMIAASASISKSSALQIFQSAIHTSPIAYLIQYRLAQAAEALYTTEKSVSSIAEEAGFTSSGYFCKRFRQYYNMTPNEYRQKSRIKSL